MTDVDATVSQIVSQAMKNARQNASNQSLGALRMAPITAVRQRRLAWFRGPSRWPAGFSSEAVRSGIFFFVESDPGFRALRAAAGACWKEEVCPRSWNQSQAQTGSTGWTG